MEAFECLVCGAESIIYGVAGRRRRTCSRECAAIRQRLTGSWVGPSNPRWKGGIGMDYYRMHKKSACERCGRVRGYRLEVHHKDENRENNDPANLETLCASCHKREHAIRRKAIYGWSPKYRCCIKCGSTKGRHAAHGLCNTCYIRSRR